MVYIHLLSHPLRRSARPVRPVGRRTHSRPLGRGTEAAGQSQPLHRGEPLCIHHLETARTTHLRITAQRLAALVSHTVVSHQFATPLLWNLRSSQKHWWRRFSIDLNLKMMTFVMRVTAMATATHWVKVMWCSPDLRFVNLQNSAWLVFDWSNFLWLILRKVVLNL